MCDNDSTEPDNEFEDQEVGSAMQYLWDAEDAVNSNDDPASAAWWDSRMFDYHDERLLDDM